MIDRAKLPKTTSIRRSASSCRIYMKLEWAELWNVLSSYLLGVDILHSEQVCRLWRHCIGTHGVWEYRQKREYPNPNLNIEPAPGSATSWKHVYAISASLHSQCTVLSPISLALINRLFVGMKKVNRLQSLYTKNVSLFPISVFSLLFATWSSQNR